MTCVQAHFCRSPEPSHPLHILFRQSSQNESLRRPGTQYGAALRHRMTVIDLRHRHRQGSREWIARHTSFHLPDAIIAGVLVLALVCLEQLEQRYVAGVWIGADNFRARLFWFEWLAAH